LTQENSRNRRLHRFNAGKFPQPGFAAKIRPQLPPLYSNRKFQLARRQETRKRRSRANDFDVLRSPLKR
jgi:hypothetical protein